MNEDDIDAFLAHYGVKGMKWGKRKNKPNISDLSNDYLRGRNERAQLEETYRKNTAPRKTNTKRAKPKRLSDAELRARVNRLSMEKQYAELKKGDRERQAAGREAMGKALIIGGAVALSVVLSAAAYNT